MREDWSMRWFNFMYWLNILLNLGGCMANKTLKEKIKDLIFWMIMFFIFYLIVGYLIQSQYLHSVVDVNHLYDLFRDSLTLTAYFLAPFAAFMLFNDWREQHKTLKVEKEAELIIHNTYTAHKELLILFNTICSGKKDDRQISLNVFQLKNELLLQSKFLRHNAERLKKLDTKSDIFVDIVNSFAHTLSKAANQLHDLHTTYSTSDDSFVPNINFMEPLFESLDFQITLLNDLVLDLQV